MKHVRFYEMLWTYFGNLLTNEINNQVKRRALRNFKLKLLSTSKTIRQIRMLYVVKFVAVWDFLKKNKILNEGSSNQERFISG